MLHFYEALRLQNHTSAVLSTHSRDNTTTQAVTTTVLFLCCCAVSAEHCGGAVMLSLLSTAVVVLCCLCWALLWCCCDDLCPLVTLVAPVGSSSSQLWPHRDQSCHVASPVNLPSHQPPLCFVSAGRDLVTSPQHILSVTLATRVIICIIIILYNII